MVRKLVFYAEVALICATQLFALAYVVLAWVPALAQAQTSSLSPAPSATSAKPPSPAPALGSFLTQYPIGKYVEGGERRTWLALGPDSFADHRLVKVKRRADEAVLPNAAKSFAAECSGLGGQIGTRDDPEDVGRTFAQVRGLSFNIRISPLLCVDAARQPLGAMLPNSFYDRNYNSYAAIFIMTREATIAMMASYHREKARERRDQAARSASRDATEKRISDWRTKLIIGTETHCGPVLDLRGPMAQVAYGTQAGWVRRERLYPPGDAGRCWEFSGL